MRQVDIQARSVDEAVRLALEQLGRTRDQVKVEVLATDPNGDEVLVRVTAPDLPGTSSHEEVSPRGSRRLDSPDYERAPRRDPNRIDRGNRAGRGDFGNRRDPNRADHPGEPDSPDGDDFGNRADRGDYGNRADRGDFGNRADRGNYGNRPDRGGRPGMGGMGRAGGGRYGRPDGMRPRPEAGYDPDIPGEIELDSSLQPEAEGGEPENMAAQAAEILQHILLGMRIRGRIVRRGVAEEGDAAFEEDRESIVLNVVDLNERDQTALIGRRGETLDSIQFLVNLILSRKADHWARITVDVEGYRLRRKHALINLARRTAEQVQSRGQAIPLEAMPPHERRIVHMTLADHPAVTTESSGVEPDRRVVVLPK